MKERAAVLEALGGEVGCRRLSAEFYARVGRDPVLRPLFPGKSLRCAIEEFAAFLVQFLGGDEGETQFRWWLSLRESHARFRIEATQRSAWLGHMAATLEALPLDPEMRMAVRQFFAESSAYVTGKDSGAIEHEELGARWREQRVLDDAVAAIVEGDDRRALALAAQCPARPAVFVGLLGRMVASGRDALVRFVVDAIEREPSLATKRYAGRTLLHAAAGAGCEEVVGVLLRVGVDPNLEGRGGHSALYCVANECASEQGPAIVRALVEAGADVNARGGVTKATALHMAARRGHAGIAIALLDCGAVIGARDAKGDTPLQRAKNCRKHAVERLLEERGATVRKE